MYLIGLTGNIATGKSTVRLMLQQLGARVIDADALSHAVLLKGTPAWRAVVDHFGLDILYADGDVDRQKLGAVVFGDPKKLQVLESVVHPAVSTELALLLRDAREPVVVLEAIKLVEAGLNQYCDALWIVTAPPAEQKRRLVQERGMNEIDAQLRLRAQPPLSEKLKLAQVVIDNGGSVEATRVQVTRAFAAIEPEKASDKTHLLTMLLGLTPAPAPSAEQPTPASAPARPVEISVRRARPADVGLLATLLAQVDGSVAPLSRGEVLKRFGRWAYWLAEAEGEGVAIAAWRAQDLVAILRDLWTPNTSDLAPRALSELLAAIEPEASSLQCEVVALITTIANDALVRQVAVAHGYTPTTLADLHPIWRKVAQAELRQGESLYIQVLREQMVTKPI